LFFYITLDFDIVMKKVIIVLVIIAILLFGCTQTKEEPKIPTCEGDSDCYYSTIFDACDYYPSEFEDGYDEYLFNELFVSTSKTCKCVASECVE